MDTELLLDLIINCYEKFKGFYNDDVIFKDYKIPILTKSIDNIPISQCRMRIMLENNNNNSEIQREIRVSITIDKYDDFVSFGCGDFNVCLARIKYNVDIDTDDIFYRTLKDCIVEAFTNLSDLKYNTRYDTFMDSKKAEYQSNEAEIKTITKTSEFLSNIDIFKNLDIRKPECPVCYEYCVTCTKDCGHNLCRICAYRIATRNDDVVKCCPVCKSDACFGSGDDY